MPKFDVLVSEHRVEYISATIEADSEDGAREEAMEMLIKWAEMDPRDYRIESVKEIQK